MAILGIDEVGRGPLAGPLVVGAVILPEHDVDDEDLKIMGLGWILELKDSKKLSARKREKLSEIILKEAVATGLGWVPAHEIDEVGISGALKLATRRAVEAVRESHTSFSQIVIDGKVNFLAGTSLEKYVSTMPKADDLVKEVSAASIIAKVARDGYMTELASNYSEYGFERHVGYGTAAHMAAIKEHGICPEHRKSFEPIKSMVEFERGDARKSVVKNTTLVGREAERAVVEYLKRRGQTVIKRNAKSKFYEIDIVSVDAEKAQIFFTEVKYRKNADFGGGLAAVDKKKQEKMKFAAECFLKANGEFSGYHPQLAVASVSGEDFAVEDWFVIY